MAAICQWVHEHGLELLAALNPAKRRLPSYATLRCAIIAIDIDALEQQVATHNQAPDQEDAALGCLTGADGAVWHGQAVDGKDVRGASAHGATVHLVGMARHESGYILHQVKVNDKSNEITAVPLLLQRHSLPGMVTTMDALLTQQSLAEQILAQGGEYLMVVKRTKAICGLPLTCSSGSHPRLWETRTCCASGRGAKDTDGARHARLKAELRSTTT